MRLEGSCHCGAVRFRVESETPYPYQACYCSSLTPAMQEHTTRRPLLIQFPAR
jgi:hypothetical protein